MAQQTRSPASVVNDNSYGTAMWSDPSSAAASDDMRASVSMAYGESSNYLRASGFGFSIPEGATIDFINVKYEGYRNNDAFFISTRLVKGGEIVGNELAANHSFNDGGPEGEWLVEQCHDWGVPFTPAEINGDDFGAVMAQHAPYVGCGAFVDSIVITIDYTEAS